MKARRADADRARLILTRLLRTPKSRSGLIAAVKTDRISRNFVYGWITEQCRSGRVTILKAGVSVMYQNTDCVPVEKPEQGFFPSWLEPRSIPRSSSRRMFLDGREVNPDDPQREEQEEEA